MKKLIAACFIFGSTLSFAGNPTIRLCSDLASVKAISNLEIQSYYARGYENVTVGYMRVVLGAVKGYLYNARNVISEGHYTEIGFINSIIDGIVYEYSDTYNYETYSIPTATRIFRKLESDTSVLYNKFCE